MRRVLVLILLWFMFAPLSAVAQEKKEGYLGRTYLNWNSDTRLLYTVGVADALDAFGIRCPMPTPTYDEIMSETVLFIYQNPSMRELFAAKSVIGAMAKRGCRKE